MTTTTNAAAGLAAGVPASGIAGQQGSEPAPSGQVLDVRGRGVRVLRAGQGPPLVFLHGAGDLGDWSPALSLLARDFSVYRPDHPGFNYSDDDPSADSVLDIAFGYLDLLDCLGLRRASLVGVSLGGWIAAQIAVLAPDRVGDLVLAGPAGLRAEGEVPDIFTLNPVQLAELLYHGDATRAAQLAAAEQLSADPDRFQRYLRNRIATAHLAWNPYLHDPKLAGRLHRISAPVLVIWGAQDRLLPVAQAEAWLRAFGDAGSGARVRLELVEQAGHLPHLERPAEFVTLVRQFLADGSSA